MLAFSIVYHAELIQVVFAGKFVEYSWLLPMILFFSVVNSIAVPVTLVAQYEEKAGIILLSKIFVAYNVVAMLILLPVAGLYGAILARGSAEAFKNLFIWWWVRHRARWTNALAVPTTAVLLWGAVIGACYAAKQTLDMAPMLQLMLGAAICVIGVLVYVRTPAIGASDRGVLASLFHGREARTLSLLGLMKRSGAVIPIT
jgi:O-antigen/teichoic acid export membrane protein